MLKTDIISIPISVYIPILNMLEMQCHTFENVVVPDAHCKYAVLWVNPYLTASLWILSTCSALKWRGLGLGSGEGAPIPVVCAFASRTAFTMLFFLVRQKIFSYEGIVINSDLWLRMPQTQVSAVKHRNRHK
ncbi:hypothetical protein ONS95_005042 [Cadophora gregata]|uniref:uncharacterized protein n=1 Tax=Cadophora gregata TaxID=51156 RepID=UPI0026DC1F4A|nr:uncharacterized protein ONS95_005042 [Cadophora gregata]KAK0104772.1 hypothetical protein ONS95_005042 [Cadophora gregata]KAK0115147.1 hypothetical protein ONS96_013613 [Cadophora gregata f. sp. sojae]